MSAGPILSIDRAVAHYVSAVNVDTAGMQDFYESLPFEDKPPLESCRMHLSALGINDNQRLIRGITVSGEEDTLRKIDPLAPEADIVLFLGSFLHHNSEDDLTEVVKHELTHYAEGAKPSQMSDEEFARQLELKLFHGSGKKYIWLGKAALFSAYMEVTGNIINDGLGLETHVLMGVGIATAHSLISRRRRNRRQRELHQEIREDYLNRDVEKTAHTHSKHEDDGPELLAVGDKVSGPEILIRSTGFSFVSRILDQVHERLALKPAVNRSVTP